MFTPIIYRFIIIILCSSVSSTLSQGPDHIFKILPSTKIVVDREDDVKVTCRYSGDCDASLYKKGYPLDPVQELKRSKKNQPNIRNSTKELTWKYHKIQKAYGGTYFCELTDCAQSRNNEKKSLEIEVKAITPPNISLIDHPLKNVTVNSNASFRLSLTGSPMPRMNCSIHNGSERVIFCSSKDMKKVMYDNPSRPCKSPDLHYQIRSYELQTVGVVFDIMNVTFGRDNGSTIYCHWKNDKGAKKNISMRIVVMHHERIPIKSPTPMEYKTEYKTSKDTRMTVQSVITGIVIGSVLLLLIVVAFGTALYCRERKLKNTYKTFLHSSGLVDPNKSINEQMHDLTYDKDWEFPFDLLETSRTCLGEGNFGKVFKGRAYCIELLDPKNKSPEAKTKRNQLWMISRKWNIQNQHVNTTSTTVVAIKTVKDRAPLKETQDLIGELKLMMHIGKHNHIVNLLGVCYKKYKLRGILEYCAHGDLSNFLRSKRNLCKQTWVKTNHNEDKGFTFADQVTIAKDVTEGMQFLASKKCIHRDLAARNILLAENYVAKIADFGIARNAEIYKVYRHTSLPYKWTAIESLFTRVFTKKSDVWSFGILLWEIMTLGDVPYREIPYEEMKMFLNTGKRLEKPDNCTDELYGIMLDCWKRLPDHRPSFQDIHDSLRRLLVIKLSDLDFEENMNVTDLAPIGKPNNGGQYSSAESSYIKVEQMGDIDV